MHLFRDPAQSLQVKGVKCAMMAVKQALESRGAWLCSGILLGMAQTLSCRTRWVPAVLPRPGFTDALLGASFPLPVSVSV